MYNTVGETAGVTQDVGSDPTVGDPADSYCCTLCGIELGDEVEGEEDDEEDETWDEGMMMNGEDDEGVDATVYDFGDVSGMEEEGEEVDGEPDTTGDDRATMTSRREEGQRDAESGSLHPSNPEHKTS